MSRLRCSLTLGCKVKKSTTVETDKPLLTPMADHTA